MAPSAADCFALPDDPAWAATERGVLVARLLLDAFVAA